MAKKEFSDFQTFVILTLVCIGAAAVLAGVYFVTKEPIKKAEAKEKEEALLFVLPPETKKIEPEIFSFENSEFEIHKGKDQGGKIVGYALQTASQNGYGGEIVFLVGINPQGTIRTYKIMSHKETPGLGDNLTKDEFKKQFIDKGLDNFKFKVQKDGGDVEAITAATISSRAGCEALEQALTIFREYKKAGK